MSQLEIQAQTLRTYAEGIRLAFAPTLRNGRPEVVEAIKLLLAMADATADCAALTAEVQASLVHEHGIRIAPRVKLHVIDGGQR
jgi:hypothetical protein